MLKSKKLKNWSIICAGGAFAIGVSLCAVLSHSALAAGGGTLIARSQLRRTTDPSPRSSFGSVLASVSANGKETFQVNVSALGDVNFGPFIVLEPALTTNITQILPLAPLERTNFKKGTWVRTFVGSGQAPADILPLFANLTEVSNNVLHVAQPGVPIITTVFTNIIGGVTNVVTGVTNVVGGVTNVIDGIVIPNPGQTGTIFSVMWAPIYPLTLDPGALSYHRHGKMVAIGDASPKASATVSISFNGNTGRSILKIAAKNLTSGQQYTLYVADDTNHISTVLVPIDDLTQKNLGSNATFARDTQFGDPLPMQARDIGDLSGHIVEIRDAFGTIHLQGDMP